MVQSASIVNDIRYSEFKTISALQGLQDPNVETMINLGTDETPAKKASDYVNFVYGFGPKPFWYVLISEGNPDGHISDPLHGI